MYDVKNKNYRIDDEVNVFAYFKASVIGNFFKDIYFVDGSHINWIIDNKVRLLNGNYLNNPLDCLINYFNHISSFLQNKLFLSKLYQTNRSLFILDECRLNVAKTFSRRKTSP